MSVGKKIVATIIVLAVIAVVGYFLITSAATGGGRGGEGGSLGSGSARTIVTLTVMGGSAFITGFGFRDVIGRAVAARQRARMKAAQQPVRH